MSFDTRLSPARVTVAAASEFPRWALFALLIAYIAAGLFGRDPWYAEDGLGFGIIESMARGERTAWWLPNIAGEWLVEEGPLPFWVGAVFVWLLGPLLGAIAGSAIARKTSFLLDRRGQPVFDSSVSIIDDPHRPRGQHRAPSMARACPPRAGGSSTRACSAAG